MGYKYHFNPRSDERSDTYSTLSLSFDIISIHAPTNGATFVQWILEKVSRISIHAPTNGATIFAGTVFDLNNISIHAPTNGAT